MTEPTDHYFTHAPAAIDAERRRLHTQLAGREVSVETAGGWHCRDVQGFVAPAHR